MKKHQIKNQSVPVLFKITGTNRNQAFTLVELIIVITILAILATIAFVSFSNYTASSRDTKRIVTIESIAKGLNIFQTQTGKYPNVDNQSSTGIINSDTLSFVGEVGDNVSRLINIFPTPKDPVSGNNFKYATSFDNKYFQVAGTQEKPVAEKTIINQSYANTRQAKVLGNYNGLLKKDNKLYNLPSLIYTGSGNFLSNTTYFVIDKGQNIPYKIISSDLDNSVQTSVILNQLTGTSSVSLTGVIIPSTPSELKNNIGTIIQILGYSEEKVGTEAFGSDYFLNKTQSGSGLVSGSLLPIQTYNSGTTYGIGDKFQYTRGVENFIFEVVGVTGNGLIAYTNDGNDQISLLKPTDLIGIFGRNSLVGSEYLMKSLNAGASTVWSNQSFGSEISYNLWATDYISWAGGLFMWGNNNDYSSTESTNPSGANLRTHSTTWWSNGFSESGICGNGFKIPSSGAGQDWEKIYKITTGLSNTSCLSCDGNISQMVGYLKLPPSGYRDDVGNYLNQGTWDYWSTNSSNNTRAFNLTFNSSNLLTSGSNNRTYARSVRCIKN